MDPYTVLWSDGSTFKIIFRRNYKTKKQKRVSVMASGVIPMSEIKQQPKKKKIHLRVYQVLGKNFQIVLYINGTFYETIINQLHPSFCSYWVDVTLEI